MTQADLIYKNGTQKTFGILLINPYLLTVVDTYVYNKRYRDNPFKCTKQKKQKQFHIMWFSSGTKTTP